MKKVNLKTLFLAIIAIFILLEACFFVLRSMNSTAESELFKIKFHANKERILCLGESTTEGGYPILLQRELDSLFPNKYHVYDLGKTAVTSFYFKRNIEKILSLVKPSIVISMLGINDNFMLSQEVSNESSWFNNLLSYRLFLLVSDYKNNSFEQQALRLINANKNGVYILKMLEQFDRLSLSSSYLALADHYEQEERQHQKSLDILTKGVSKFPEDQDLRFNRLWSLNELPSYREELRKEIDYFSKKPDFLDDLGQFYLNGQEDIKKAKSYFRRSKKLGLISSRNDLTFSNLKSDKEKLTHSKVSNLKISYYLEKKRLTPSLLGNLEFIFSRILESNAKSIIMSYPLRSILPMKESLDKSNIFISNEEVFKEALEIHSYNELFKDSFAGDFGHLTEKGKKLLVSNILKQF